MQVNPNVFNSILTSIIAVTSFAPFGGSKQPQIINIAVSELFASVDSIGAIAICAAEGNCNPDGSKTAIYKGHKDPGNGKHNRGFCSDQGRSKGSIEDADRGCLEYLNRRIPHLNQTFGSEGIEPETEVFVNAVDLWNQASPRVSNQFAKKYRDAIAQGKQNKDAIIWARVESFRKSKGELEAGNASIGLFGICNNPANDYYKRLTGLKPFSEEWRFKCIEMDQSRRVDAINRVLEKG